MRKGAFELSEMLALEMWRLWNKHLSEMV